MKSGFIKISRDILSWRWYQNLHTKGLFVYLLTNAAWKPYTDVATQKKITRGQCLFSLRRAAQDTGMSVKAIRCSLDNLEETGEIKRVTDRLASVITIQKYDAFQSVAAGRYIKLPRWHPNWDWFENLRTSMLYVHLILSAAYTDTDKQKRGQVFTQLSALSAATGQTERAVRTDLAVLEQAGLLHSISSNRGRLLSIVYYDLFQGQVRPNQMTGRMTGTIDENRQAESENPSGIGAQQVTGQICFTNRVDKPFAGIDEADRGTPVDRQKGTPDVEKGHTDCHSRGTPKGTPSIIEENKETKNGRKGEERAQARERPLPGVPGEQGCTAETAGAVASADDVAALYGCLCPSLPPLSLPLTKRQRRNAAALVGQIFSLEQLQRLFLKAEKSTFLSGQAGDGIGWQADFDWLIDIDHARRVLAGKYDSLWGSRAQRSGGQYTPAAGQEPTYDMDEYVNDSVRRLLNSG